MLIGLSLVFYKSDFAREFLSQIGLQKKSTILEWKKAENLILRECRKTTTLEEEARYIHLANYKKAFDNRSLETITTIDTEEQNLRYIFIYGGKYNHTGEDLLGCWVLFEGTSAGVGKVMYEEKQSNYKTIFVENFPPTYTTT